MLILAGDMLFEEWETGKPIRIVSDCFYCEICNAVTTFIGLDKNYVKFCLSCQNELNKGHVMNNSFRKKYMKYLAKNTNGDKC